MEKFKLIEKYELCLTFQSEDTGVKLNLTKSWIRKRFKGSIEQIVSFDNTDDGELIFHTLENEVLIN